MKRLSGTVAKGLGISLLSLLFVTGAWAKPTTSKQAKTVVANWLGLEAQPLGSALGQTIKEVQTFADDSGKPLYYVVYLNPRGFVLVSGEDLVEPIICFVPTGTFNPSPSNPLGALVSRDVPGRVQEARQMEAQAMAAGTPLGAQTPQAAALGKWALLEDPAALMGAGSGMATISDVRVSPFIQSHWSQTTTDDTTDGAACYNYYTFPFPAGSATNYPCGCVATAMGQLMRYWQHPQWGVGTGTYQVKVDTAPVDANLRGGNGYGGPYDWANMALSPKSGSTETQRQAIGALLYDAGLSVNMSYTAGSSSAYSVGAAALVNAFGYSNAIRGRGPLNSANVPANIPAANRNVMVNSNLDANFPVLFGIYVYTYSETDPTSYTVANGHAIVCDGYGYNVQSLYHHLNLGWSGQDDAWYNLPLMYTTSYKFNGISEIAYNVFVTGAGEIISGRVTDAAGKAVSGATVTATGGHTATTNASGIYALAKVPSNTTFTITVSKAGYNFDPQTVTTGKSVSATETTSSYVSGNLWGVDFVSQSTLGQALDNSQLVFTTSGTTLWYGQSDYWYYGGSAAQSGAIADGQSSALQTTVSGPGELTFYWACSSTAYYNRLTLTLDSAYVDMIAGFIGWTQKTLTIPAGLHTVTWTYSKTPSIFGALGSDCGWVDKVVYVRAGGKVLLEPVYQLLLLQ